MTSTPRDRSRRFFSEEGLVIKRGRPEGQLDDIDIIRRDIEQVFEGLRADAFVDDHRQTGGPRVSGSVPERASG